jgi:hypothetical protein
MGFCPYFLHEYSSAGMSAIFELTAGTRIVVLTLFFLHKTNNPRLETLLLKKGNSCFRLRRRPRAHLLLEQWHRLPVVLASECPPAHGFRLCPDSGGFPADMRLRPLETLPSPPVTDEKKDVDVTEVVAADMLTRLGFVKSSVRLFCGSDGAATDTGATTVTGAAAGGAGGGGAALGAGGGSTGPRRNRAWPVRSRMEITLRNLDTAWSAISPNGCCGC